MNDLKLGHCGGHCVCVNEVACRRGLSLLFWGVGGILPLPRNEKRHPLSLVIPKIALTRTFRIKIRIVTSRGYS